MAEGISLREFARRDGCSDTLVRRAVKNGKLQAFADGTLNPADVKSGWRFSAAVNANASTNTVRIGPDDDASTEEEAERLLALVGPTLSYANALRQKENYVALLRQLEYEQKSGALIDMPTAEAVFFETFREHRDSWLNWPDRVGPLLAAQFNLPADRVTEALSAHVNRHLASLGEPEPDFKPQG